MYQIATFHSLFGAMSFKKKLAALGDSPVMMPVPRALSASCGTCVRFTMEFDPERMFDEDIDKVVRETDDGGYQTVFENK